MNPARRQPISSILLLIVPLLAAMIGFFGPVIRNPDQSCFGQGDDALKNYYTPWYHAAFDKEWMWFRGMNYPHGDHVVFADAQPLISNSIKALDSLMPGTSNHTVGIMNMLMLAQILLTGWCFWRILLLLSVEAHFAAIGAVAITLLSPQILRLNGHFALSYAFILPLLLLLRLKAHRNENIKQDLLLGFSLFMAAWIHPYYLMIGAALLSAWEAFSWILWPSECLPKIRIVRFFFQVLLPGILFFALLKFTDSISDRPANPTGMSEYVATWRSVFLPIANPFLDNFTQPLLSPADKSWEGIGYVGLVANLGLVVVGCMLSIRLWKLRKIGLRKAISRIFPSRNMEWSLMALAAVALLLFSMGFPFGFKPELLTEVFPPIKQFRSLGRFTWVFHALWMPFFVVLCFRLLKVLARRRKAIAWGVGMAICTLTISEGLMQWQSIRFSTGSQAPMMVQRSALPWLDEIPRDSYSCIVALPWFHVGSENLITTQTAPTAIAFSASLRTGLPLLNVMMSRTSLSQTWAQFQLATEPAEPLEILKSLPDKRPMLAIRQGIRDTFDGAYFKFGMGSPNHPNEIQTYPLDLWSAQKELLKPYVLPADSLLSPELFRLDFDADGDVDGMWSSKGKRLTRKDNHFLFQGKFPQLKPNQSVVVSCWARLKSDGIPMTYFGLELHDAQGNNVLWSYPTFNGYVRRIEGEWALVERLVTLPDAQHSLSVNITRWSRLPATIDIDELSIRLANRPSRHQKPSGIILVNNRKAGNLPPNLSSLP